MTDAQAIALCRILKGLETFSMSAGRYEIKQYEVEDCGFFLSVYAVVGMKGDEGTMAIICRDRVHLFVGKRGGITYPVSGRGGKHVTRNLSHKTMLSVAIEQRR